MRRTRLICIWLLLGLWACGDAGSAAGGCACAGDYEYPRDEAAAVPSQGAARLRVTETGFGQVAKMVPGFIGEGCAETDGDPNATCEVHPDDPQRVRLYMGEPCNPLQSSTNLLLTSIDAEVRSGPCNGVDYHRSSLDLHLDSLQGNVTMRMFEDGQGEAIEVILGCAEANMSDCLDDGSQYVKASMNMVWLLAGFWTENACWIHDNDNVEAGLFVQKFRLVLRPKIELGDDLRPYLTFEADDTTVDDLNLEFAIGQDGAVGDPACGNDGCATWCTVTDWVTSVVEVMLETEFIASVIGDVVVDGVIGELTKDPIEISGELDLASLLPVGNERASPTGFIVSGDTESPSITGNSGNVGMNFDFNAGFFAEYVPCAPEMAAPSWVLPMLDPPGAVIQAPDPVTGEPRWEPFDFMLMVGDVLIERAAYNLFRGGSLCLNLGAEDLSELSGGAFVPTVSLFSLIAPDLANLTEPDSPVLMRLNPSLPMMVDFGTGLEEGDTVDSHIRLLWPELELALYPLMDDSYQRVLAFAFNLNVGVSLIPTPAGNLRVMIDELALDDVVESYNELGMPFDPGTVADLIGVFLPAVLDGAENLEIDLSSQALGFPVSPRVRKIGAEGEQKRHLGIYLKLCTEPDILDESNALCYESPQPLETEEELTESGASEESNDMGVEVEIIERDGNWFARLPEGFDASDGWELAWTVDGRGPWFNFRPFRGESELRIEHPLLGVPGAHRVSAMMRRASDELVWLSVADQFVVSPAYDVRTELVENEIFIPEQHSSTTEFESDDDDGMQAAGCTSLPPGLWWLLIGGLLAVRRRRSVH